MKRIFFTLIIATAFLSSCKKMLNQEPKDTTYEEKFWKSENDMKKALAGAYASLRSNLLDQDYFHNLGDMTLGSEYIVIQNAPYFSNSDWNLQVGKFEMNYLDVFRNWSRFYSTILQTNLMLQKLPLVPDNTFQDDPVKGRKNIAGQTLFIRSYVYFQLLRTFGDVPLVTTPDPNPIANKPLARTDKNLVVQQILNDLDSAANCLDMSYEVETTRGTVPNKASVMALQAQVYLWRACVIKRPAFEATPDMSDVNKASDLIETIVNSGLYGLAAPGGKIDSIQYAKVFTSNSRESLFELYTRYAYNEGSNNLMPIKFLRTPILAKTDYPNLILGPSYVNNLFPRIVQVGPDPEDTVTNTDIRRKVFLYDADGANPVFVKYSNVIYNNPNQQADPYLDNNVTLLRYADLLLSRMEIAVYKGQLGLAYSQLRDFRQSRSRPQMDSATFVSEAPLSYNRLLDEIMTERACELFMEGQLYFDDVRMKRSFVPWLTPSRYNQEGFLLPLDPALFNNNRLLVQNKYWAGKI
ncbi:RagB/SusD family nutrient uptake outer membrane protein [Chitinophaga polysaccharea]|uniref:RagB/SusD family nutrient uptake outer membrane protein n=1 Tax=Chitinophaga TaxID=79328 RepID=UPI00145529DA|nr:MULTISPECIES: RagB/SusD family nutrient uptake outer membrane protein [Chitinophaga]NLR58590.1 RagB/SusD family nutrient uptake outer membrane protein [Chitinophaga polysaccharea]NLU91118.1 RagB/SusD family nutrient uptake outer membrane protein [Chitinophaga sp. Ak27]